MSNMFKTFMRHAQREEGSVWAGWVGELRAFSTPPTMSSIISQVCFHFHIITRHRLTAALDAVFFSHLLSSFFKQHQIEEFHTLQFFFRVKSLLLNRLVRNVSQPASITQIFQLVVKWLGRLDFVGSSYKLLSAHMCEQSELTKSAPDELGFDCETKNWKFPLFRSKIDN